MKKISILFASAALASSCAMNDIPLENMPPEIAFRDSLRVEMFVNELYAYLHTGQSYNRLGSGGTGGSMFDCVTDLAVYTPVRNQPEVNKFTQGTLNASASGNPDARWAEIYQAIRKCNVVLDNIDYAVNVSQERKNRFIGEATLHKAIQHFEAIRRFGGIPIMDDILDMTGDINIPRSTFEASVKYVVELCDRAAPLLPTRYADNDYGRLTRGAAYGLKARVLLYAASPLYNENPVPGSTELQRYASPDHERWKYAADAALQVIDLKNSDGSPAHSLFRPYSRLFFTRAGNYESLIMKQQGLTNSVEKANGPSGYQNARGNTNATLELVNMYETKNGLLPADDPDYDPQKPYENRDERFNTSILYSGAQLWGRSVETFEGGMDYPASSGVKGCVTGFMMYKHIDPQTSIVSPEKTTYHDWPILRYADVLLIYAEAMNEYMGMGDDDPVTEERIYECVNEVRDRAGLPPVSGLTRGEMRTLIHRERAVEFAFEESRYGDLKRWREAEVVLNRPVHGVKVTKSGSEIRYDYTVDGDSIVIEDRVFPMKFYYYPIPQSELDKNTALVQNPNW